MRATWLADVLRRAGLRVTEVPGWETRGTLDSQGNPRELSIVNGVVCHHTATPPTASDDVVVSILVKGRADLPGPLSQTGLSRSGTYYVVAAGRCNHNGFGRWGNDSLAIEAFNDGEGERWPRVQLDAFEKGAAAILKHVGKNEAFAQAHREQDPGRKTDPVGIDMMKFRQAVARHQRGEEDDMFSDKDRAVLVETSQSVDDVRKAVAGLRTTLIERNKKLARALARKFKATEEEILDEIQKAEEDG